MSDQNEQVKTQTEQYSLNDDRRVKVLSPGRMVLKRGRKGAVYHVCVNENCRHRVEVDQGGGNDADE